MKLNDLKIKTRLTLGFAAMAALMALLGLVALANLMSINERITTVVEDRYAKVQIASEIRAVNNDVSQALRNLFVMSDPDDIKAQYDIIGGSSKQTNANMELLGKLITDDAGKAALAKLAEARSAYRAPREKVIEQLKSGSFEMAKIELLLNLRPKQTVYMQRVEDLIKLQNDSMAQASAEAHATVAKTRIAIIVVLVWGFGSSNPE